MKLLFLVVMSIAGFFFLFSFFSNNSNKLVIASIPPDSHSIYPSYDGALPWHLSKPVEKFPFPIRLGEVGPIKPLFAKSVPYPFYCRTEESGLGQPLVDNHSGYGVPVFTKDDEGRAETLSGYSKDCSIRMNIQYYYKSKSENSFQLLGRGPNDAELITIKGHQMPFVIRVETGTINRFIYSISSLKGPDDKPEKADMRFWNSKLIYYFKGGIGIGKQQGRLKQKKLLGNLKTQLEQGYAVLYSTGNKTGVHYNNQLAEDTAARVKLQFTSQYGEPLYTMGVGGSGGAIQQYLIAQNYPGLLDGIIPLYSYPDMMTQTIYSFDCELLEHFFDVIDKNNSRWKQWENKALVQGLGASSSAENRFGKLYRFAKFLQFDWLGSSAGASECTNGWRGLAPYVNNPTLTRYREHFTAELLDSLHFSIWDDLKKILGVGENGYAKAAWDNVGVQYGLRALRNDQISISEFLKINRLIGGWKPQNQMSKEKFWFYSGDYNPLSFDIHSAHNMLQSPDGKEPALRSEGDVDAIEALYRSGAVFWGNVTIPILDLRHYLEEDLDMHHLSASFSARLRIAFFQGQAEHHVIWVTKKPHTPITAAVQLMDEWLMNLKAEPRHFSLLSAKPEQAIDSCFSEQGSLLFSGNRVWDGEWNAQPEGDCMKVYPANSNSRIEAGESWLGLSFKCQLQSVEQAVEKGIYGAHNMHEHIDSLEHVFPEGVCDFSKEPMGVPEEIRSRFKLAYRK